MGSSFIKIPRELRDWKWYHDSKCFHLLFELVSTAKLKDEWYNGKLIERGQTAITLNSLSKNLSCTVRTLRTCMSRLKSTNKIAIKTTNRFSIITICNFDDYQGRIDGERQAERQAERQPNDKQTTNKTDVYNVLEELKEVKETKEIIHIGENGGNVIAFGKKPAAGKYGKLPPAPSPEFMEFYQLYPGTKSKTANWENLFSKYKSELDQIYPLLVPAVQAEISHKAALEEAKGFVPQWKNLQTWINNRCWEQELGVIPKKPDAEITMEERMANARKYVESLGYKD